MDASAAHRALSTFRMKKKKEWPAAVITNVWFSSSLLRRCARSRRSARGSACPRRAPSRAAGSSRCAVAGLCCLRSFALAERACRSRAAGGRSHSLNPTNITRRARARAFPRCWVLDAALRAARRALARLGRDVGARAHVPPRGRRHARVARDQEVAARRDRLLPPRRRARAQRRRAADDDARRRRVERRRADPRDVRARHLDARVRHPFATPRRAARARSSFVCVVSSSRPHGANVTPHRTAGELRRAHRTAGAHSIQNAARASCDAAR